MLVALKEKICRKKAKKSAEEVVVTSTTI